MTHAETQRKNERIIQLRARGWELLSRRGVGSVRHRKFPNIATASVAAAWRIEFDQ